MIPHITFALLENSVIEFLDCRRVLHLLVSQLLLKNYFHNLNVTNPTASSVVLIDHGKRSYQNSPSRHNASSAFVPESRPTISTELVASCHI